MKTASPMTIVFTNVKRRFVLSRFREYGGMGDKVDIVKGWQMKPEQPQLRTERSATFLRSGR